MVLILFIFKCSIFLLSSVSLKKFREHLQPLTRLLSRIEAPAVCEALDMPMAFICG